MGIIAKFKKMFSCDIKPDVEKLTGLVCPFALKHSAIKIDSTVIVPKGYSFVIGHTGKALDSFNEGEYVLGPATLPECCRKLKIHKQDKKGGFKKSFKADVYFVNLAEFGYSFKTYDKAELGGRASGIFTVGLTANAQIKVVDAKRFMEALLGEYDYIKQNEAEKILKIWTSELIVKILNKYNFALSEFLNSDLIIENNLKMELGQKFRKLGLILENLTEIKYNLPKKHQKTYENNLLLKQKQLALAENIVEQEQENDVASEPQIEQTLEKNETKQEQPHPTVMQATVGSFMEEEYVPYGSIIIEQVANDAIQTSQEILPEQTLYSQELKDANQSQKSEDEFVDLNLDNLYNSNKDGIKCDYCGYLNDKNSTVCEVCERSLKGE